MPGERKQPILVYVTAEERAQLQRLADERMTSLSTEGRRAIVKLLADESGPLASWNQELKLRLADIQSIAASVRVDEDTGELREDAGSLLSALDYALRGDPGCVEPSEWRDRRVAALLEHAEYLDLGRCS